MILHSLATDVLGELEKRADPVLDAAMQQQMPQQSMPPAQPQMVQPAQQPMQQAPAKGNKSQMLEERLANLEAAMAEVLKRSGMADPEKALAAQISQQPGAQPPAPGTGPVVAAGPLDPNGMQAMQQMKMGAVLDMNVVRALAGNR